MIARKGTVVKVFRILRWGEHFEVVPDQHGRTDGQKRQYCSGQEPAAQTAHRRHGGIAGLLCGAVALHRIHDSDIREETAMKRFKGMLWDITRMDTFDGYREDMTLYCKRR